jgi:phosphatidylserine/phosphatidylglycerophosphate/cardiolipin synthase-like enzyme
MRGNTGRKTARGGCSGGSGDSQPSNGDRHGSKGQRLGGLFVILLALCAMILVLGTGVEAQAAPSFAILPTDGPLLWTSAFASAKTQIRILICVLQDPAIISSLASALQRGVNVKFVVDQTKYFALAPEREALASLTALGAELHVSNSIFPRSFPKIILIDRREFLLGSACLDAGTFAGYRDFAIRSRQMSDFRVLERLFENDWAYSRAPNVTAPAFNPTPPLRRSNLMISPVDSSAKMVELYQSARRSLDVYSELLGNPVLEGELVAAVTRGVRVRLISTLAPNGVPTTWLERQTQSLSTLKSLGIDIRVSTGPGNATNPYMHARAALVDGIRRVYLGSISLNPDSTAWNREVGILVQSTVHRRKLRRQFDADWGVLASV